MKKHFCLDCLEPYEKCRCKVYISSVGCPDTPKQSKRATGLSEALRKAFWKNQRKKNQAIRGQSNE